MDFCIINDEEDQAIELKQIPFAILEHMYYENVFDIEMIFDMYYEKRKWRKNLNENMADEEIKGHLIFFRERRGQIFIESFYMKLKGGILYMAGVTVDNNSKRRLEALYAFRKQTPMDNLKFSRCFNPHF